MWARGVGKKKADPRWRKMRPRGEERRLAHPFSGGKSHKEGTRAKGRARFHHET
jgi:hypothetical protein